MNPPTPTIQDLARRLLALESRCGATAPTQANPALRVCEKVRLSLVKFVGVDGYRSLVSRALSMARAESPSLKSVQVRSDGTLHGFEGTTENPDPESTRVVLVHLLGLLVTFIGEPLTVGLIRSAWPDELLDETHMETEKR